jgi:hypothetical protein
MVQGQYIFINHLVPALDAGCFCRRYCLHSPHLLAALHWAWPFWLNRSTSCAPRPVCPPLCTVPRCTDTPSRQPAGVAPAPAPAVVFSSLTLSSHSEQFAALCLLMSVISRVNDLSLILQPEMRDEQDISSGWTCTIRSYISRCATTCQPDRCCASPPQLKDGDGRPCQITVIGIATSAECVPASWSC